MELTIPKEIVEKALDEVMNQVWEDTGMTLKECYEMQIPQEMKYANEAEWCPRCTRRLLNYKGLKIGYCKFCGQRIKR